MGDFDIICSVFYIFNALSCFLIIYCFLCYKQYKSKQDILVIESKLFECLISLYLFIFIFGNYFEHHDSKNPDVKKYIPNKLYLLNYFLPIFLIIYYCLKSFKYREDYISIYDSQYRIKRLTTCSKNLYYEYLILLIICIYIFQKEYLSKYVILFSQAFPDDIIVDIDRSYLYVNDIIMIFVLFFCIFVGLIYFILMQKLTNSVQDEDNYFRYKRRYCILDFLINYTFLFWKIAMLFIVLVNKGDIIADAKAGRTFTFKVFAIIYSILFLIMMLLENILTMLNIFNSNFYHYCLSHTYLKKLYCIFGRSLIKKHNLLLLKTINTDREVSVNQPNASNPSSNYQSHEQSHFNNTKLIDSPFIIHLNRVEILFEEFEIKNFNNCMDIICSSIDLFYSRSRYMRNIYQKKKIRVESTFHFDSFYSDRYVEMFEFKNEDLDQNIWKKKDYKVMIKSYAFHSIKEICLSRSIDVNLLKTSLFSHFQDGKFLSWIEREYNEGNFHNRKWQNGKNNVDNNNCSIRTFDNNYTFEFFYDIDLENRSCFVYKYLKFIKDYPTSFLPLIAGIFEIKIRNFKPFKLILLKNKLINDLPKEYYNSWDLIKVWPDTNNYQTIDSSRANNSILKTNDEVKPIEKIIAIYNTNIFQQILMKDFELFRELRLKDFSFMMINYELGINTSIIKDANSISEDVMIGQFQGIPAIGSPTIAGQTSITGVSGLGQVPNTIGQTSTSIIGQDKSGSKLKINRVSTLLFTKKDISEIKMKGEKAEYESRDLDDLLKVELKTESLAFDGFIKNIKSLTYFSFANVFQQFDRSLDDTLINKYFKNVLGLFDDILINKSGETQKRKNS